MERERSKCDVLFELSWEVCNKVGGIYTVVSSKADLMKSLYKEYFLIGPYFQKQAKLYFVEQEVPEDFKDLFEEIKKIGIVCHYGYWDIDGDPITILIDYSQYLNNANNIKAELWQEYKIDSLNTGNDFNEPLVWSWCSAILIDRYKKKFQNKCIICHAHEWLSGFANLYLKKNNKEIGTVFLTHATTVGRTLAAMDFDLYGNLDKINPIEIAYKYGIQAKHLTEVECAKHSDVFATVSEITALEAEKIIGKKPDILLLNGLDISKYPNFEELSIKHSKSKLRIQEFIKYFFFPYYSFDLEKTLIFFIVGRYEYKNKGLDIFIEALTRLNNRLKEEKSDKTVVVFFWIPRDVNGAKAELSSAKIRYNDIHEFVETHIEELQENIVTDIITCRDACDEKKSIFKPEKIFNDEFLKRAKILMINFAQEGFPLLVTHNIPNENEDAIIKGFLQNGLDNREDDRVKVVFYPVYLTGIDGMLDLPYNDAISGCHLGLFPSYYEPWGYTPLETAAMGVPALTTDLGGFGRYLISKNVKNNGVFILRRFNRPYKDVVEDFAQILYDFVNLNKPERIKTKMLAKETASLCDWDELIFNYVRAHNMAIKK